MNHSSASLSPLSILTLFALLVSGTFFVISSWIFPSLFTPFLLSFSCVHILSFTLFSLSTLLHLQSPHPSLNLPFSSCFLTRRFLTSRPLLFSFISAIFFNAFLSPRKIRQPCFVMRKLSLCVIFSFPSLSLSPPQSTPPRPNPSLLSFYGPSFRSRLSFPSPSLLSPHLGRRPFKPFTTTRDVSFSFSFLFLLPSNRVSLSLR